MTFNPQPVFEMLEDTRNEAFVEGWAVGMGAAANIAEDAGAHELARKLRDAVEQESTNNSPNPEILHAVQCGGAL